MLIFIVYTSIATCFLAIILYNNRHFTTVIRFFNNHDKSIKVFTIDELKHYNGVDKKELYLAVLGNVFDVTNGSKHYGPGESYNVFVGRDASRNFITGKFNAEDISDDVIGLSSQELRSLNNWLKFYKKEYKKIGKLIGRYYNSNGKLTPYGKEVKSSIKNAENSYDKDELLKRQFPPCNVEWDATAGSRVWCTRKSGGIERSWIGVPRMLYEPGSDSYRCACISPENQHLGNIKEYKNCASDLPSCNVNE